MQRPDNDDIDKLPVGKLKEILAQRGALSSWVRYTTERTVLTPLCDEMTVLISADLVPRRSIPCRR